MPSIHLMVEGLVQGVGFRWYTLRVARRAGLAGWVANLPDGTVEVAAAGSRQSLAVFQKEIRTGPPGARVDAISRLAPDPEATLPDPFEIK